MAWLLSVIKHLYELVLDYTLWRCLDDECQNQQLDLRGMNVERQANTRAVRFHLHRCRPSQVSQLVSVQPAQRHRAKCHPNAQPKTSASCYIPSAPPTHPRANAQESIEGDDPLRSATAVRALAPLPLDVGSPRDYLREERSGE